MAGNESGGKGECDAKIGIQRTCADGEAQQRIGSQIPSLAGVVYFHNQSVNAVRRQRSLIQGRVHARGEFLLRLFSVQIRKSDAEIKPHFRVFRKIAEGRSLAGERRGGNGFCAKVENGSRHDHGRTLRRAGSGRGHVGR